MVSNGRTGSSPVFSTKALSLIRLFLLDKTTMAHVYILHSAQINKYYTGSCINLDKRLLDHQTNKYKGFTGRANDWNLFLSVDHLEHQQARKIEQHIKSMKSSTYILNLLKYPDILNKLKIKYQTR